MRRVPLPFAAATRPIDAATPSERAAIAQMLKDTGGTIFVHGASTFLQDERLQGKTSPASDADQAAGEGPACCKLERRVHYARAGLLTWAWTQRVNARGRPTGRFRQPASRATEAPSEFVKFLLST